MTNAALWHPFVATREGGVDRNCSIKIRIVRTASVATREGGVDRNKKSTLILRGPESVATREGGVDRNLQLPGLSRKESASPPARVAWIETIFGWWTLSPPTSPPARVAWIETLLVHGKGRLHFVATREGGVDRNIDQGVVVAGHGVCRHPRGWRG